MAHFNYEVYRMIPDVESDAAGETAAPGFAMKAHFTSAEAAAYMEVPLETFRLLATDPSLEPIRIMGVYHYRVADVQRYMARMEMGE